MHQASEHPEFVKTVNEIRKAEEEQERLILSAKEKSNAIVRDARENAQKERLKTEEEIVAFKNAQLHKGSEAVEAEVQKILKKAKDEGAGIGKKGVNAPAVSRLVKELLG